MNSPITTYLRPAACVALSLLLVTPVWAAERQLLTGYVSAAARLLPVGRMPGASQLTPTIGCR